MIQLLYITPRIPAPDQRGDQIRAFFHLKELSRIAKIVLVCLSSEKQSRQDITRLESMGISVQCYFFPKWKRVLALRHALFSQIPFQVAYFYSRPIQKTIEGTLKNIPLDIIHCHLIRTAFYAEKLKAPIRSLDYMDAYGFGMELRFSNATKIISQWILKSERDRLYHFETHCFDQFNQHFAISKQDGMRIRHPRNHEIVSAANGVDFNQFFPKSTSKKYDLVFMGNMDYPPNIAAVRFIVEEILPLLIKKLPSVNLLIAGRSATKLIQSYQSDRIDVVQNYADISDAIASAKIMLAPMIISIGLQNKILQSMAMKVPVITSEAANNAIGAIPNDHILTANSAEEFASQTLSLLTNPLLHSELSESAFGFVHHHFTWETCSRKILDKLL